MFTCHHDKVSLSDECKRERERPSQQTWAVSSPVGCYHLHPSLPFLIIQPKSWY